MRKNACKLSTWGYEAIYRLGYNPAGSELPSAAICLPMLLIAAAVINNQGWPGPAARIGQVLNVLSWGFALLILAPFALGRAWFRFLSYLLLAGLLLRDFTFGRTAYLIAQNTLVFFAGSLIVLRDSRLLTRQFSILAGASAILMFLQVLGVGEFTQVLATHGSLGNGVKLETTPQPTFLVSAENLQVSFIQGRPSGPLYSNQFASLVAIFAMGAFLCFGLGTRTRNFASALAISTMSVLTLAKIVILSATAMVAATLFSHDPAVKFRAKWIAGLSAVVFALYSALFPGVVQTYLGLLSISLSFYSRIFDFLFNIGADPSDDSPLSKYLRQQSTDAVGYIHANNMVFVQAPPKISGLSQMLVNRELTAIILILAIGTLVRTRFRSRRPIQNPGWILGLGLLTFLIAAPFLNSSVYWFMLGVACGPLAIDFLGIQSDSPPASIDGPHPLNETQDAV